MNWLLQNFRESVLFSLRNPHLRDVSATFRELKIYSADLYAKKVLLQYIAVRAFQPEIVVELGLANGVSSAYILLALQKNERGALYSVGLNDPQSVVLAVIRH
jgi:predicted O-methyltransferase YrrM